METTGKWQNIRTYQSIYEAELRRDILEKNDIPAVILKKEDPDLLMAGEFVLLVEEEHVEKAVILLEDFNGFIKINSFPDRDVVENFKQAVEVQGVSAVLNANYFLGEYELYVAKADAPKAREVVMALPGWLEIGRFEKVRQTLMRTNILKKNDIAPIILKDRDEEFNVEDVRLYVEQTHAEKAGRLITELAGWQEIAVRKSVQKAAIDIQTLEGEGIDVIEVKQRNVDAGSQEISLYVEESYAEQARLVLEEAVNWVKLEAYDHLYQAQLRKEVLEKYDIPAVIVNERDSMLLLGDVELYVKDEDLERAKNFIENLSHIE